MVTQRIISRECGFTLVEVMTVVAIVGILAGISVLSYVAFGNKAKGVEAEAALAEVNRLEMLYYDARGQYSSDLQAIGYTPTPPLKYYTVEIQVAPGAPGVRYRATAKPKDNPQLEPWVLTRYENGNTVLEKLPPATVTAGGSSSGGSSDNSGSVGGSSDTSGVSATGKGSSTKGPGTVIQTVNGSSTGGGSMGPGGNQGTNSSQTAPGGSP